MSRGFLTKTPNAADVFFEDPDYIATDAQAAILESATFYNFSFKIVALTKSLKIPQDQQMATFNGLRLEGSIRLDGELILP